MSWYRRNYVPGGTYFFTLVVAQRRPLFAHEANRKLLAHAMRSVRVKRPFKIVAQVLLPDHLHAIWTLPRGDDAYSLRWRQIKEQFPRDFLAAGGRESPRSVSRIRHRERAVWQRRFWEHTCDTEEDLEQCVDYVHWNPRKHGLVNRVADYPFSTFHSFVERGQYDLEWGGVDPCPNYSTPEWDM
jgi:putative transposase